MVKLQKILTWFIGIGAVVGLIEVVTDLNNCKKELNERYR